MPVNRDYPQVFRKKKPEEKDSGGKRRTRKTGRVNWARNPLTGPSKKNKRTWTIPEGKKQGTGTAREST